MKIFYIHYYIHSKHDKNTSRCKINEFKSVVAILDKIVIHAHGNAEYVQSYQHAHSKLSVLTTILFGFYFKRKIYVQSKKL